MFTGQALIVKSKVSVWKVSTSLVMDGAEDGDVNKERLEERYELDDRESILDDIFSDNGCDVLCM